MNKYYCTGEEIENGYLKVVVPSLHEDFYCGGCLNCEACYHYLSSLPLAALVVGGKTGWLGGYEERYEAISDGSKTFEVITKEEYDVLGNFKSLESIPRRIVLVKKPEQEIISNRIVWDKPERFKMPTDKTIIDFALIFNDGKIEPEKLADMVSMTQFIVDRLYENGDATIPSLKEGQNT